MLLIRIGEIHDSIKPTTSSRLRSRIHFVGISLPYLQRAINILELDCHICAT